MVKRQLHGMHSGGGEEAVERTEIQKLKMEERERDKEREFEERQRDKQREFELKLRELELDRARTVRTESPRGTVQGPRVPMYSPRWSATVVHWAKVVGYISVVPDTTTTPSASMTMPMVQIALASPALDYRYVIKSCIFKMAQYDWKKPELDGGGGGGVGWVSEWVVV